MADSKKGSPLSEALDKNEEATEEVKKAADQLAVVHAVLDTKLGQGADVDDHEVAHAVAETHEVEKRLEESAEKLDEVNETLRREAARGSAGAAR